MSIEQQIKDYYKNLKLIYEADNKALKELEEKVIRTDKEDEDVDTFKKFCLMYKYIQVLDKNKQIAIALHQLYKGDNINAAKIYNELTGDNKLNDEYGRFCKSIYLRIREKVKNGKEPIKEEPKTRRKKDEKPPITEAQLLADYFELKTLYSVGKKYNKTAKSVQGWFAYYGYPRERKILNEYIKGYLYGGFTTKEKVPYNALPYDDLINSLLECESVKYAAKKLGVNRYKFEQSLRHYGIPYTGIELANWMRTNVNNNFKLLKRKTIYGECYF